MALLSTDADLANDLRTLQLDISDDESDDDRQQSKELWDILREELESGKWDLRIIKGEAPEDTRKRRDDWEANFSRQHHGMLESNSYSSNIFYYLAKAGEKKTIRLKLLVSLILHRHRGLLTFPEDLQGLTAFQAAVQAKNHKLIRYVLESYRSGRDPPGPDIDEVLRIPQDGSGNNAIHLAMISMTPISETATSWLQAVDELIEAASTHTLSMQNQRGLTPLHIAVHGEKCTPQQFKIVKRLVEKCDAALDTRSEGKTGQSPYQYHLATYDGWQKKLSQQQASLMSNGKLSLRFHRDVNGRTDLTSKEALAADLKPRNLVPEKPRDEINRKYPTSAQKGSAADSPLSTVKSGEASMGFLSALKAERGPDSNMKKPHPQPTMNRPAKGTENNSPTGSSSAAKFAQKTNLQQEQRKPKSEMVTSESVDMIADYLKLVYLRKKNRLEALNFLYGGITDKQLQFNLYGKDGVISEHDFKKGYKCTQLEDILQSVYIPNLTIKPRPADKKPESQGLQSQPSRAKETGSGRTDFKIIFNWLQKEAKVKKIIRLKVDDSQELAHQDMVIEEAVAPFDVEVLDWVKVDLCGETIARIAPNIRHLNLYWSGKNAVLRGWSDSDGGLAGLRSLERIDVSLQSDLEGETRTDNNFNVFEQRFIRHQTLNRQKHTQQKDTSPKDMRMKLHKNCYKLRESSAPPTKADALQNHRWLKCMEDFSQFLPIKIAIIDDGIDTTKSRFHGRVIGGQSFGDQANYTPSFCVSAGGHGTTMAHQVTRIVPGAKIISLKLGEYMQSDGPQFVVQGAADAVRYACNQGVDIINMSWSIEETAANEAALKSLSSAIDLARERNILMFCSASDQGTTNVKSFPGTWWSEHETLIRIGAATSTGKACSYVSQSDVDFIFPGRIVEKEQDDLGTDNSAVGRPRNRSTEGSSLGTAFASGLAGLILYILQVLKCCQIEDDMLTSEVRGSFDNIKNKPSRMKEVFERIQTAEKFVEVWQVFDTGKLRARSESDKLQVLAKIHSRLLGGLR
ncbi:hypothetical protein LQW54_007652 [Pestalotiopsis sp. IQ-011]